MPLLGSAAMLLSFDIAVEAIAEHDRWHTQEHLPERLAIAGFLRGTRWTAIDGVPRYMVVYEVENIDVLTSAPYLSRLNNPTPWTARMMSHYRGMRRGLCTVAGSFGVGQGGVAALVWFEAEPPRADELRRWLLQDALPGLAQLPDLGSAHLLQGAQAAASTVEQRIRGADAAVDPALVITGYDFHAVAAAVRSLDAAGGLSDRGAFEHAQAIYGNAYSVLAAEVGA